MSRVGFIGEGLFLTKPGPSLHAGVNKSPFFLILYGVPNSAFFPYSPRMDLTPTALSLVAKARANFLHVLLLSSHQPLTTSHCLSNSFRLHSYITLGGVGGTPAGYGPSASVTNQTRRMPDTVNHSIPPRPGTRLLPAIRRLPALTPLFTPPATDLHPQSKSFHSSSRTSHSPIVTALKSTG